MVIILSKSSCTFWPFLLFCCCLNRAQEVKKVSASLLGLTPCCLLSRELTLTELPPFVFQHQVLQPCSSSSSSHPQREWSKKFLFLWQGLICLLLWNIVDKLLTTLVSDLIKWFFYMSLHSWSTTNQLSPSWSEIETLQLLKSKVHNATSVLYCTLESCSTVAFGQFLTLLWDKHTDRLVKWKQRTQQGFEKNVYCFLSQPFVRLRFEKLSVCSNLLQTSSSSI